MNLKKKFAEKALPMAAELKELVKKHGDTVIDQVTLAQLYRGMRGVKSLITETSLLDDEEGIRFRDYSIPQLREKLPKAPGCEEPLPEGIFYLMLMGELPTEEDVKEISQEWAKRGKLPAHVAKVLDALPLDAHPMTQFTIGINALQTESDFEDAYWKGLSKKDYWDPVFEDVMTLIACLPYVAAYVYRRMYKNGEHIAADPSLDWAANFAHMLGVEKAGFQSLMRLYLTIHADHEGGNVSAHTTHLAGSTLSDPYRAFTASMNSLAGPLHGLANQQVIKWVLEMREKVGTGLPSKEQIADYIRDTINAGRVVPGYGHAVLRQTDPRFTAQLEFAKRNMPDDELVNVIWRIYEVAPTTLGEFPKIKNPWPNVDAHSGALLMHYGFEQFTYYTVLFGVSRALGVLASLCWDRALGLALERPKSVRIKDIKQMLGVKELVS